MNIKELNERKNELILKIDSLNKEKSKIKDDEINELKIREICSKIDYVLINGSLDNYTGNKKNKVKNDRITLINEEIQQLEKEIKELKENIKLVNKQNNIDNCTIHEFTNLGNGNYKLVLRSNILYVEYTYYSYQWYLTKNNEDLIVNDESKLIQLNNILLNKRNDEINNN